MDIREYLPKQIPYRFVLFYNISDKDMDVYRTAMGGQPEDNALLTYAYIDSMAGLSYYVVCCATVHYGTKRVDYHPSKNCEMSMRLREGALECNAILIGEFEPDMLQFSDIPDMIKEGYGYHKDKVEIRDDVPFDLFRHPSYPQDIYVYFISRDEKLERMWVREVKRINDSTVEARLLDEPYNRMLGLHKGDMVTIRTHVDNEGKRLPVWADGLI